MSGNQDAQEPSHPSRSSNGRQPWRILLVAAVAVVALATGLLVGRGTAPVEPVSDPISTGFLRDMKIHHAQAVQMSTIVHRREPRPDVNYLAEDILTTQQGQIGIMMGFLELSGQTQSSTGKVMAWMGAGHTGDMPGMAGDGEIAALKTLPLPQLREQYLRLMIRHHRGAIPMAEYAAERARNAQVATLAAGMATGQESEIEAMQRMLVEAGLPREPEATGDHSGAGPAPAPADPEQPAHNSRHDG